MRARRRRPDPGAELRRRRVVLILAGVSALALGLLLLRLPVRSEPPASPPNARRSAAIVDQVALTDPNPAFTEQALAYLIAGDFNADVYEGADVSVDFFRTLPQQGYDLILFRTHSTNDFVNEVMPGDPVYLYTGQPHDRFSYTYHQLTRQLMSGSVLYEPDTPPLFIVGPGFVRDSMAGHFDHTLLIIGGCDSLSTTLLADALVERGASAVIGWDGLVDTIHNDRALLRLLRGLAVDGLSVADAVARARSEVGPDPAFGSEPQYYPAASGTLAPFGGR